MVSCPEQKLVLDDMHIREDLVYDKHSGRLIDFTNLGSVSDHLLASERALEGGQEGRLLAKSIMIFMVKGLSSSPIPYVFCPILLLVTFSFIHFGRQSSG